MKSEKIGPVIGMLHLPALPGSPRNTLGVNAIIEWVLKDSEALYRGGVDALLMENFGDVPFHPTHVPAHTIAFMTAIGREVKRAFDLPLGVNVLRNDAMSAIAVASAISAVFIRVNIHTDARVTDQGLIQGMAHETLRYRKLLGSDVQLFADVDSKHSAPLAARDLESEVEELVSRGCADAVIVTGPATGKETALEDLQIAKRVAHAPVYAGSGVDARNVAAILQIADGVIVGTALKHDGVTTNAVDSQRVQAFIYAVRNRKESP